MTVIVSTEEALRRLLREELRDELRRLQPATEPTDAGAFMTVGDVARRCQVRTETVRDWIRDQKLQARRLGRHWRVRSDDFERFVSSNHNREDEPVSIADHIKSLTERMRSGGK